MLQFRSYFSNQNQSLATASVIAQEPTSKNLSLSVLFFCISCVVYGLLVKTAHPFDINLDCALLLQMAKMLLSGKQLYVQIMEYNMPFPIFVHVIPVWLSNSFHLSLINCFHICVAAIALLCVITSYAIATRMQNETKAGLALVVAAALLQCTVGYNYGQREHLFILLALPFLLLRACRWHHFDVPLVATLVAAAMGGIAFTIKPYLLIPVAFVEFYWLLTNRKNFRFLWSLENLVAGLIAILQFLYLVSMPEAARQNFFGFLLPMVLGGYKAMNSSLWIVASLHDERNLALLAVIGAALAVALRRRAILMLPMVAWTVGAYLDFVLQSKNWSYHLIPFYFGVLSLLCLEFSTLFKACMIGLATDRNAAGELYPAAPDKVLSKALSLSTIAICLLCAIYALKSLSALRHGDDNAEKIVCQEIVDKNSSPGDGVAVLDTIETQSAMLVRLNRQSPCRYLCVFPFIMLESMSIDRQNLEKQESEVVHQVNEDLNENKPKLVLLNVEHNLFTKDNFSLQDKLKQYGLFDDALSHYSPIGRCQKWQVYSRL